MSELYYHKKRNIICRLIPFAVTIPSLAIDRQTAPKVLLKFTYLQQSSNVFLKNSLKLAHFVRHLLIVLPTLPLEIFGDGHGCDGVSQHNGRSLSIFPTLRIFTLSVLVFWNEHSTIFLVKQSSSD